MNDLLGNYSNGLSGGTKRPYRRASVIPIGNPKAYAAGRTSNIDEYRSNTRHARPAARVRAKLGTRQNDRVLRLSMLEEPQDGHLCASGKLAGTRSQLVIRIGPPQDVQLKSFMGLTLIRSDSGTITPYGLLSRGGVEGKIPTSNQPPIPYQRVFRRDVAPALSRTHGVITLYHPQFVVISRPVNAPLQSTH